MYSVYVMTKHNCTLDNGLVCRYKVVARLHLFTSFVPTPSLRLVVLVNVPCVTMALIKYTLVTFLTKSVCIVLEYRC
jgi:hypothetical protein